MTNKRPLSYSQMSCFAYNKNEWYERYVLGKKGLPNKTMQFGSMVGRRYAEDPTFLPFLPRYPVFEQKLLCSYEGIDLIGFIDSFDEVNKKIIELKTGAFWDEDKVNAHYQLDFYVLCCLLMYGWMPEEIDLKLIWLPTSEQGDFSMNFSGEPAKIFQTKRTLKGIEKFGKKLKKTWEKMEELRENRLPPNLGQVDPSVE